MATGPLIPKCYVHVENAVGEGVLQKGKKGCIFFYILMGDFKKQLLTKLCGTNMKGLEVWEERPA